MVLPTPWFWNSGLQNCERTHFCWFNSLRLCRYLVTAAQKTIWNAGLPGTSEPVGEIYWEKILSALGETYPTCSTCPNHGAWQVRGRSKTETWANSQSSLLTPCKNVSGWTSTCFCGGFVQLPAGQAETKVRIRAMNTRTNTMASKLLVSLIPLRTQYDLRTLSQEIRAPIPSNLHRVSAVSQVPWTPSMG